MGKFRNLPTMVFRIIKLPPQVIYTLGFGSIIGRLVLLLTTTGRVTGKLRITPLQYERIGGSIFVGSSRGLDSDWVRNIQSDPNVEVRIGSDCWNGFAEVIDNSERVIDFLKIRLQNHPKMVGAMFKSEGLSKDPTTMELVEYASNIVIVEIKPVDRYTNYQ